MRFKSIFSKGSSSDSGSITDILKKGKSLEDNGKVLDAYFLYRGLVAAYPDCKACRAHMGKTKTTLTHQGIEVSIIDSNVTTVTLEK